MKQLILSLILCAGAALGADITGTWKGTAETPNGSVERTFVFKQDGEKLTGETSSEMLGKSTIAEGKVTGDDVSFSITVKFQGEELTLNYKGRIAGNEIKFHVEGPAGGPSIDYVAKKVS
jgi:hypothetical protein